MRSTSIIRPPDIVVGGLEFYRDSSSIFFFIRQLSSELAERNPPKTGHALRSECDLKMYVRNLEYLLALKIGGSKPTVFDDFAT